MTLVRLLTVFSLIFFGLPAASASDDVDLQALIDGADAGSVITLGPGTYRGNVVIDKPLEIHGVDWPVVDGGGIGNVIEIYATDVTITGLVIRNTGTSLDGENAGISANADRVHIIGNRFENVLFGVFLRQANDSVVSDNHIGALEYDLGRRGDGIRLWESDRSVVSGNVVDGSRDTVLWFSDDLVLRGNTVTNGRYGIHFMYSDRALVELNYLADNSVGGFLMYSKDLVFRDNVVTGSFGPSGYGVGLKDMDGASVTGNHFLSNRIGVYFDNSPATPGVEHDISANLFAYNDIGALFLPSVDGNVLTGNSFIDNAEQVGVQGKGDFEGQNVWTVDGVGNHWSDFAGYDADGDGFGDVPYELADLFSTITDKNPELRFFNATPASKAIDLAGRMFPAFTPRPKVTDTQPIIEAPELVRPVAAPPAPSTLATGVVAIALLSMSAALLLLAVRSGRRIA